MEKQRPQCFYQVGVYLFRRHFFKQRYLLDDNFLLAFLNFSFSTLTACIQDNVTLTKYNDAKSHLSFCIRRFTTLTLLLDYHRNHLMGSSFSRFPHHRASCSLFLFDGNARFHPLGANVLPLLLGNDQLGNYFNWLAVTFDLLFEYYLENFWSAGCAAPRLANM